MKHICHYTYWLPVSVEQQLSLLLGLGCMTAITASTHLWVRRFRCVNASLWLHFHGQFPQESKFHAPAGYGGRCLHRTLELQMSPLAQAGQPEAQPERVLGMS